MAGTRSLPGASTVRRSGEKKADIARERPSRYRRAIGTLRKAEEAFCVTLSINEQFLCANRSPGETVDSTFNPIEILIRLRRERREWLMRTAIGKRQTPNAERQTVYGERWTRAVRGLRS
jgi:hypothetical protein